MLVPDLPDQLPCQPQERLLEVVVRLRRNLEVLEVLFAMEGNSTRLYFTFLKHGVSEN
jgi:hypothetical protein